MERLFFTFKESIARSILRLAVVLAVVANALSANAYTSMENIVIGNFKYNLFKAENSDESNYAFCLSLSTAGASVTDLICPGYVKYNNVTYRVDGVSAYGFQNNTNLKTIRFGYGITRIQYGAFMGCSALTTVYLPSSIDAVYNQAFANCSKLAYVTYAGDTPPLVYTGTFQGTASTKYLSCATYRGANAMKADATWSSAFSNIGRHIAYYAYDFRTYNSDGGCYQYYVIKNGIPYSNYNSSTGRSSCVLVGAGSTNSTYSLKLEQSIPDAANNAPGYYHFYGVADSAFINNTFITKIVDNSTLSERIGRYAFYNCTNLTSAQVRSDSIMNSAFYNCTKLTSVDFYNANLGQGIRHLGSYAFGQTALTSVTLPKNLNTNIGYAPFYNCQSLKYINVDADCPIYCSYYGALYNKSRTQLYQIPGAWTSSNTTDNLAPELVTVLMFAAYGNNTIQSLRLPYGVTTIQDQAFSLMSNLSTVQLPSSITSIAQNAFRTSPVTSIICAASTPPSFTFGGMSNLSSIKLTVPYGAWSAYKSNSYWKQLNLITTQGSWCNAWDYKSGDVAYRVISGTEAAAVSLHDGANSILGDLYLQGKHYTVTEIGNYASYNCSSSQDMSISGVTNIKRIMGRAFYNKRLTNFPFGANLVAIEDSAFMNTSKLNVAITFASSSALKTIDPYAFYNSAITSFKAGSAIVYIGSNAFASTKSLASVDLSLCNNLTYIQNYCFKSSLCDVVKLPNSVVGFGDEAFRNCSLATFNFPSKLKTLGYYSLHRTGIPGEIELPYGVTTLEEGCLASYNATRIVLPATVSNVHSRFYIATEQTHALNAVVINTSTPLGFTNDNEDINYDYQTADNIKDATIYVPVNKVSTWKADPHWKKIYFTIVEGSYDFTNPIGDKYSVLSFSESGTGTCCIVYNPDTYNVHSSILITKAFDKWGRGFYTTQIGEKCFYNSNKLTTVSLDDKVQVIGNYAFAGSALNKIQTEEALNGASSPSNGFIRTSVHTIGAYAFNGCKNLHELFLPHINNRNAITCGNQFFGNNADDFKLWVDYRRLSDFIDLPTTRWDESKIYPHLLLDSKWQSFACMKPINFQGTNVEAYTVTNYHTIDKIATLSNIANLGAKQGGVVHGEANGTFYRLNYATSGSTSTWLDGVTTGSQTINSTPSLCYFKLNGNNPVFEKITTNTTFYSGYAYLKLNSGFAGNATTIPTNLSDSGGDAISGDVNGDGIVSSVDVTALYNYLLNNDSSALVNGDQDGDGSITAGDIVIIYNILLGQ